MTAPSKPPRSAAQRNARLAILCGVIFFGMVGAAFAAVPLYKRFCQLTGFGGTPQRVEANTTTAVNKTVRVSFDTNVRDLPWKFEAEEPKRVVKLGETALTVFKVTNTGKTAITGHATYNILPAVTAGYFNKIECFCFTNQVLQPGQTAEFPVVFFIDPAYARDFETRDTTDVTLSYTFFPAQGGGAGAKGG